MFNKRGRAVSIAVASEHAPQGLQRQSSVVPQKPADSASELNHLEQPVKVDQPGRMLVVYLLVHYERDHSSYSAV